MTTHRTIQDLGKQYSGLIHDVDESEPKPADGDYLDCPTGCSALDDLIGGGYPAGCLTEVQLDDAADAFVGGALGSCRFAALENVHRAAGRAKSADLIAAASRASEAPQDPCAYFDVGQAGVALVNYSADPRVVCHERRPDILKLAAEVAATGEVGLVLIDDVDRAVGRPFLLSPSYEELLQELLGLIDACKRVGCAAVVLRRINSDPAQEASQLTLALEQVAALRVRVSEVGSFVPSLARATYVYEAVVLKSRFGTLGRALLAVQDRRFVSHELAFSAERGEP